MIVNIVNLKLSAQRGLLGNIFPKLRAVCVNSIENVIYVYFYVEGEISEDDEECCESTIDQIISDFCNHFHEGKEIEYETPIIRLDYPEKPSLVGYWVYYRRENYPSSEG